MVDGNNKRVANLKTVETVSQRLKHARTQRQWTQAHLAIAAGLTTGAVGNIEAGMRQAKGSLPALAEALGVSYAWLANGTGEMLIAKPVLLPSGLTPGALELGQLYDMIPAEQRIKRAQAFAAASAAILAVLEAPASAPSRPGRKTPAP